MSRLMRMLRWLRMMRWVHRFSGHMHMIVVHGQLIMVFILLFMHFCHYSMVFIHGIMVGRMRMHGWHMSRMMSQRFRIAGIRLVVWSSWSAGMVITGFCAVHIIIIIHEFPPYIFYYQYMISGENSSYLGSSFSRISTRRIFPLMVLGSSVTNSTILGYL